VLAPLLLLAAWTATVNNGKVYRNSYEQEVVSAGRKCAPIPGADCKSMSSATELNRTCVTAL